MTQTNAPNHAGPLAGYRILELGGNISVPFATMLLGDQGAEIIKLETAQGDQTRVAGHARLGVEGLGTMYLSANRNKRSIVLDMKTAEGQSAARKIAAQCDVVVQNFRPGVAARLGIDYETLRALREDIIYVSVDGLGSEGSGAKRRVYDIVIQGLAGCAAMQGTAANGNTPAMINTTLTDKITAYTVWQAVTAALLVRERKGIGQHISISMLDATIAFLWPDVMTDATLLGGDIRRGASPASVRYIFPTADGHVIVGMFGNAEWAGLCRAIGQPELIGDPRFISLKERLLNIDALNRELSGAFMHRTTTAWTTLLEEEDAVFAPVNRIEAVVNDPYVIALGTIESFEHPVAGPYRQALHPAKFGATPASLRRHAPQLGADTAEILRDFGID